MQPGELDLAALVSGHSGSCSPSSRNHQATMRQDLTVCAPHHIQWLLNADNSHQFTDSHLWQYQALLLEGPAIQIWICSTLNLAKLFPEIELELTDNCQQVLMQTYAARADSQETPLDNPDWTLFTMRALLQKMTYERLDMLWLLYMIPQKIQAFPLGPAHNLLS